MVFCRLDYWLISNSLYDSVTGTDIFPAIKTDHSAILLEFCNNVNDIKGPGYWKMNCSLLEDDDYIKRGTLGGTQYRNTVRKNGKYRNTASKIV